MRCLLCRGRQTKDLCKSLALNRRLRATYFIAWDFLRIMLLKNGIRVILRKLSSQIYLDRRKFVP
ncbi:hypothetical protein PAE9249_00639 [Paenibacillus sp. CECT 9249]|nr:hypothetical protein PAE9249_00639 [Paenibacillus sp. CECT 9249]